MAAALISCGAFVPLAVKWPLHTRRVSRIAVKALVISNIIQSVCLVGKGRLKERCGLKPRTNFFFFRLRNRQKLVRIRFGCGLDSRIYGMCKEYGKYCRPKTVNCMNGVSVCDFMGNPVIDPLFYIKLSVAYCEIIFAMNGHVTIKGS